MKIRGLLEACRATTDGFWAVCGRLTALLVLAVVACSSSPCLADEPYAVPTFECIGLYWNPADGAPDNPCHVRFRPVGHTDWREGLDLWFDDRGPEVFERSYEERYGDRAGKTRPVTEFSRQYRGSIVHLEPGTEYEIELHLEKTGTKATLKAKTWSKGFPVGETIRLPNRSKELLVVEKGGRPGLYTLYTGPAEGSATIDVDGKAETCVDIRASHVIVRGLTLRNAAMHGIRIASGCKDIVIDGCDISGWGRPDRLEGEKWGTNTDAAIWAREDDIFNPTIERVVVQRCRIHHPRYDTNAWDEYRQAMDPDHTDERWHPMGPQAIALWNTAGNHVFRWNEVFSDEHHYYNDIFGAGYNFSAAGFPNRDSDIYGNLLSDCTDDAIEAEGANCNVRIWGNYMDRTFVKIATAGTHVGPVYIWRNVAGSSRRNPHKPSDEAGRGVFLKAGGNRGFGGGRGYVFHNTLLNPRPEPPNTEGLGSQVGLSGWGGFLANHVSRNNILTVWRRDYRSIQEKDQDDTRNDFDYDLHNGKIVCAQPQEAHGIRGEPVYDPANDPREFFLAQGSPGIDAGVKVPNFSSGYAGAGPDMGAFERGRAPLVFGPAAAKQSKTKER